MSLLITSYIRLIISMILFTLFKNELSKKRKEKFKKLKKLYKI